MAKHFQMRYFPLPGAFSLRVIKEKVLYNGRSLLGPSVDPEGLPHYGWGHECQAEEVLGGLQHGEKTVF